MDTIGEGLSGLIRCFGVETMVGGCGGSNMFDEG
jgi:hypothetical protein